jgi:hypothetical protein
VKPKFTDGHKYPHGYTPSGSTDVRRTFERVRREQRAKAEQEAQRGRNVCRIPERKVSR